MVQQFAMKDVAVSSTTDRTAGYCR